MGDVTVTLQPPLSFILRQTGRFRSQLQDMRELWERIKPVMSQIEEDRWATGGYGEWPSGPAYHGLVRTGALRASLVDPGQAAQEGPQHLTWGTDVAYAGFHQFGGWVPGRPPRRVILELRAEDRQGRIEPEIVRWLNDVAARTWGAI